MRGDPVDVAEDASVDPWFASLYTPLPPAGDVWSEKSKPLYS